MKHFFKYVATLCIEHPRGMKWCSMYTDVHCTEAAFNLWKGEDKMLTKEYYRGLIDNCKFASSTEKSLSHYGMPEVLVCAFSESYILAKKVWECLWWSMLSICNVFKLLWRNSNCSGLILSGRYTTSWVWLCMCVYIQVHTYKNVTCGKSLMLSWISQLNWSYVSLVNFP